MPINTLQTVQYALISFLLGLPLGIFGGFVFGVLARFKRFICRDRALLDV